MNNNETVKVGNHKDNLDQNKDKSKELSLFNRIKAKSEGALKEFFRQMRRDKEVEKSFFQDINVDEKFIVESKKIDEKKELVASNFSKMMELVISGAMTLDRGKQEDSAESYIFNEESKKAMLELEKELTDPFAKLLYEKIGEENKQIILDYLVHYGATPAESKIIDTESDYLNIIKFSDNGFMLQINNKEEVNYVLTDKNAHFNIINPDGTIALKDLNFEEASLKLKELVDNYQNDFVINYSKYQGLIVEPEVEQNLKTELFNTVHIPYVSGNAPEKKVTKVFQINKNEVRVDQDRLNKPSTIDTTTTEPMTVEPLVVEPTVEESIAAKPATVESSALESSPLFNKFVISKLKGWSKSRLESSLSEKEINRQEVQAWDYQHILGAVSFSSVGYATYLENIDEVSSKNGVATKSEKAIYSLIDPNSVRTHENLSYQESQNLLWSESKKYLDMLNEEFEANKEAIEKEFTEAEVEVDEKKVVIKPDVDDSINYQFRKNVLDYSDNMGIKAKDLVRYPDFLELNEVQQQFVLEALNRSSLNKIKVDAYNNFKAEKDNKKWYNLGFALNQKFHKKKHEVLAAKEIHKKGLEGYGEAEFSWLTSIIKNGPEIKLNEDGDLDSVNYLNIEGDVDPARQELIDIYNLKAYLFSEKPAGDDYYEIRGKEVKRAREELLASAKDDVDGAQLVNKLIDAEKQLKLHHFLKSDSNNEKIIQSLVDNSLGSWQKFGMMMGGQANKAKYMGIGMAARIVLRQEVAASTLSKAFSYAIGPVVAAAMGAWRSNSRARAGLKEESELSKLGVQSDNKLIKSLNLAVGSEKSADGKVTNIGLADKLESLVARYNSLENNIDQLENKTDRTEIEEKQLIALKVDRVNLPNRLKDRIEYTSQKMEKGLVSFGSSNERATNYYQLLNSLENAKSLIFNEKDILSYDNRADKTTTSRRVTELTRAKDVLGNNKELKNISEELKQNGDKESIAYKNLDLDKQALIEKLLSGLRSLSVEDRLASFLNFKEDKRHSAEFKYLFKETTKGAVMGASFAAIGAWIFEQTGLGNWTSSQLSHLSHFTHADQAVSWIKNLFSSDQVDGTKAVEKIATTAVAAKEEVISSIKEIPKPDSTVADSPKTSPETTSKAPETVIKVVKPAVVEVVKPKVFSDKISNENGRSDSVWRSLREIFKNNSQSLGYKGDIDDVETLNHWAENQTTNAIDNSGEITDKVFEGNQVVLENEGGVYHVSVEQGEGLEPSHIVPKEIETTPPTEMSSAENTSEVSGSEVSGSDSETQETPNGEDYPGEVEEPVVEAPAKPELSNVTRELADKWHFPLEKSKMIDASHVSYLTEKGNVIVDTIKGVIEKVLDPNNAEIPKELIDEVKGRVPLNRFINRGGLDKILSAWKNLSLGEKTVYHNLNLFNKNQLAPSALLNKLSEIYNINIKDVFVNSEKHQFVLGVGKNFDMTLGGINKLVKFLARQ